MAANRKNQVEAILRTPAAERRKLYVATAKSGYKIAGWEYGVEIAQIRMLLRQNLPIEF